MEKANWEVHGSGIDYVTLTAKSPHGIKILKEYADARFSFLERSGFSIKPSSPMGYSGWQVGSTFGGIRSDGYMLRVSGQDAQEAFSTCFCEYTHITRLDVQLTVRSWPGMPQWAKWSAYQIESVRSSMDQQHWAKPHFHDNFGNGDTLNIGARQSDKYGRLYDKEMESLDPNYERCWRYEVEYKGDYASMYAKELKASKDISRRCAEIVLGQWSSWGVPIPSVKIEKATPIIIDRIETDVERKLAWLHRQVAPTIRMLVQAGATEGIDEWLRSCYLDVSGN